MSETAIRAQHELSEKWSLPLLFAMLTSAREIGRPQTAAHYVKMIEDGYGGSLDTEHADLLKSAKEWVVWAIEHEHVHGKGSLLNRSHPTHLRALEMLGMNCPTS